MENQFRVQIHKLRSSVVREVCRLLINLCSVLKDDMVEVIAALLPDLSSNFSNSKKVISENSALCAKTLISTAPSALYAPIFFGSMQSSQYQVRARFAEYIGDILILTKTDNLWIENDNALLNQVEHAISKCASDKSADVRSAAKLLNKAYHTSWPDRAAEMFSTFDSHTKKERVPIKVKMLMEKRVQEMKEQNPSDDTTTT